MWRFEFTTDKFVPYLPEEAQQNPGAYGFELMDWLSRQLAQRGLVTSYPMGEDWGWFIEFSDGEQTEMQIGCNSAASEGDGYTGAPLSWRLFVKQSQSLKQRFKGVAESPRLAQLATAVESALKDAGIHVTRAEA